MQTNESLIVEHSVDFYISDVKWIPRTDKLLVLGTNDRGDGVVKIYELSRENKVKMVKELSRERGAIVGSTFGLSNDRNPRLAIADAFGHMQILDLENLEAPLNSFRTGHEVTCIDGVGGNPSECGPQQIVTGGRDGSVKIWDLRQGVARVTEIREKDVTKRIPCSAVAFANAFDGTERTVAAGYEGGALKLYDLKTESLRWQKAEGTSVRSIEFNRKDIPMNKMVVTTQTGLNVYDMTIKHANKEYASIKSEIGENRTIWTVKHLSQDRNSFVTCCNDGSIRQWEYEHPAHDMAFDGSIRLEKEMKISNAAVHCFDWHPNQFALGLCGSLDGKIRILDLS